MPFAQRLPRSPPSPLVPLRRPLDLHKPPTRLIASSSNRNRALARHQLQPIVAHPPRPPRDRLGPRATRQRRTVAPQYTSPLLSTLLTLSNSNDILRISCRILRSKIAPLQHTSTPAPLNTTIHLPRAAVALSPPANATLETLAIHPHQLASSRLPRATAPFRLPPRRPPRANPNSSPSSPTSTTLSPTLESSPERWRVKSPNPPRSSARCKIRGGCSKSWSMRGWSECYEISSGRMKR